MTVYPLVRATDDFAVQSATLLVNGTPIGATATAPYVFSWMPTAADAGKHIMLRARVVDSSGNTTLSKPAIYAVAR